MERGAGWTTHRPVAEDGVHTEGGKTPALRPACSLVLGDENLQYHMCSFGH